MGTSVALVHEHKYIPDEVEPFLAEVSAYMTFAQMGFLDKVANILTEMGTSMALVYSRRCIPRGARIFPVEVGA